MDIEKVVVLKKDGTREAFNPQKIIKAVEKSAYRALSPLTDNDKNKILNYVEDYILNFQREEITVPQMHNLVESALESIKPEVAKSYRDYRNYKTDFVEMINSVYKKAQSIMYIGDKENSNTDSALVSTKRSLIFNQLNKELYQKFFMTREELQACRDGYIYVHDMSARRDTMNCCLCNVKEILTDGFEMGNIWYNEPKSLDTVFDVIGDITLSAASQQYGGFTIPRVDEILSKYAEMSYDKYYNEKISEFNLILDSIKDSYDISSETYQRLVEENSKKAEDYAMKKVYRDMEQGFQGWEYKFNTVSSSRGDYPFTTITIGLGTDKFSKLATKACLRARANGQGKPGKKHVVLFPKIVFTYTEDLHGEGKINEDLFVEGCLCSRKAMYPDWLSLDGDTTVAEMWHKYGEVIAPMGCRAFLSPYYERGGFYPADENDKPVFTGRWNGGAISLHLPMILAKARKENKDFYDVLDYYLELIRGLHKRTKDYLGELRASVNPLQFCEGGFYKGHLKPHEKIKPLLDYVTFSFGITALNELNRLYNGKSIYEDGKFPLEVMQYINNKLNEFKKEDHILYAVYGTPAESLCGTQIQQFRKMYGIVENVSDREYVSNSFHCHVTEDINPIQKQDSEFRFWNLFAGGRIQYVKYPISYNLKAIMTLIRRAMKMGLYEGVNLSLSYCEDCGHEELNMEVCPKCGSSNLIKIDRMNGYLSYSRVHGDTRLNAAKMAEIAERKSM